MSHPLLHGSGDEPSFTAAARYAAALLNDQSEAIRMVKRYTRTHLSPAEQCLWGNAYPFRSCVCASCAHRCLQGVILS